MSVLPNSILIQNRPQECKSQVSEIGGPVLRVRRSFVIDGSHRVSDSVLIRVATGDNSAIQECLDTFGGLVWSLARKMCNSAADAEDAVQDIFVDLWKSAGSFDPDRASESTFVTMIARRRLIDQFRRKSREPKTAVLEAVNEPISKAVSGGLEDMDEFEKIRDHMNRLKPDERRIIELSVLEGFTQGEIAETLDMPLGTVKTHARRGMKRLRELAFANSRVGEGDYVS